MPNDGIQQYILSQNLSYTLFFTKSVYGYVCKHLSAQTDILFSLYNCISLSPSCSSTLGTVPLSIFRWCLYIYIYIYIYIHIIYIYIYISKYQSAQLVECSFIINIHIY